MGLEQKPYHPYHLADDHTRQKAGAQKDPVPISRTDTLKNLQCVESLAELTLKYCLSFLLVTGRKALFQVAVHHCGGIQVAGTGGS